jgi:DNA excision repair protein ERCC-2
MQLEELFPYKTFRIGQRGLAESVYNTCKKKDRLIVEAMSGFGKTSPVLAGSILAAEEDGSHIIYVCRTKRQVFRVMEEIQQIQKKVPLSAVELFAKIDYCLLKETSGFGVNHESFKWYCSFNTTNNLCSYFLNLSLLDKEVAALVRNLRTTARSHSELLESGRRAHVCPYEVARLAMAESRIVVTTYHYLLDEAARSVLLATTGWNPSQTIAVIDEAHNLRDFLRGTSTTEFSFADLQRALKDARELYLEPAGSFLEELMRNLREFCSEHKSWYVDKESLVRKMKGPHDDIWLPNIALELSTCAGIGWQSISTGRNLPTSIMKVGAFLRDLLSASKVGTTVAKSDESFFLVNTNPSSRFLNLVDGYQSLVLLSATINPSNLFLKSIGLDERTPIHKVNPSQAFKVRTIIDTGVSTRFKLRSSETYSSIANKVAAIGRATKGSLGVFVPSYVVLESLRPFLSEALVERNMVTESRGLGNAEAEEMMISFKSNQGSVLLAVQGARFSEGEDFPGDQMDASVVVGLSLPPPSPTMYAEFADSEFNKHDTYLVVSLLPAVRKAIQSAGRHIRSPDKKGMVFLMDSRFNQPQILQMIPEWLKKDMRVGDFGPHEIETMVRDFFRQSP